MANQPSIYRVLSKAVFAVSILLLTGCAGNMHILHSDEPALHPIPFVSASSENPANRFELAAIVVNGTNSNQPANRYALRIDAYYSTAQQHSCHKTRDVDVYVTLAPGDLFELDHVRFDVPNHPQSTCHCYKNECSGLMWITLIRQDNNQQVQGELTKFGTTWTASDDKSEIQTWEMQN